MTQYALSAADLEVVLALVRAGTFAGAAERIGVDASTVFRALQRIERGLGQRLFERDRSGTVATELAQSLAAHAEAIESRLEAARSSLQSTTSQVGGTVRITSTDTILHGLVLPHLRSLGAEHPALRFDLHTGNQLADLTRRDADIALRATKRPPQHLVGKRLGPIRVAVYASKARGPKRFDDEVAARHAWVAPDDALPDHPSVVWRRRHYPKLVPSVLVASILTVVETVAAGAAIGLVPLFLGERRADLRRLTDPIDECTTDLWLLTHPEIRHLRRVAVVYAALAEGVRLE
jgi:DNA-binding transcriptional LysR family regulator